MGVGENLTKIKEKYGFTDRQMAKIAGIHETRYNHYKKGRRNMPVQIAKIYAKALDVTLDEIYR